jgi:hypothetical protein
MKYGKLNFQSAIAFGGTSSVGGIGATATTTTIEVFDYVISEERFLTIGEDPFILVPDTGHESVLITAYVSGLAETLYDSSNPALTIGNRAGAIFAITTDESKGDPSSICYSEDGRVGQFDTLLLGKIEAETGSDGRVLQGARQKNDVSCFVCSV